MYLSETKIKNVSGSIDMHCHIPLPDESGWWKPAGHCVAIKELL
jgi:hypothetical protein